MEETGSQILCLMEKDSRRHTLHSPRLLSLSFFPFLSLTLSHSVIAWSCMFTYLPLCCLHMSMYPCICLHVSLSLIHLSSYVSVRSLPASLFVFISDANAVLSLPWRPLQDPFTISYSNANVTGLNPASSVGRIKSGINCGQHNEWSR